MFHLDTLVALAEQNTLYDKLEVNFGTKTFSMGKVRVDYCNRSFEEAAARCLFLYLSNKVE